jgi:ribosomal protein L11 methyltransferase
MDYLEITINISPRTPWTEILTAQLADLGCDSFVETETGIQAYGPKDLLDLTLIKELPLLNNSEEGVTSTFQITEIPTQNWNAVWEADFEPVFVENQLAILAPFHSKELEKNLTIWIEPKMSFGTGHHQTTWMMAKSLLELEEMPASILDMGSGTGVLAILAEKLGGKEILAIDIEDWAYENALDNIKRNSCTEIEAKLGDIDLITNLKFNLIIANINKNVLKAQLSTYSETLQPEGRLLLSGFFTSDVNELVDFAKEYGFTFDKQLAKDNWACVHLIKN